MSRGTASPGLLLAVSSLCVERAAMPSPRQQLGEIEEGHGLHMDEVEVEWWIRGSED
jgi:hypothetical protein